MCLNSRATEASDECNTLTTNATTDDELSDGLINGLINGIEALLTPLLTTIEMLGQVSRHLHPPNAQKLASWLAPQQAAVGEPTARLRAALPPGDAQSGAVAVARRLLEVADEVQAAVLGFQSGAGAPDPMPMYRALRRQTQALALLYPLAPVLLPVSQLFVEPALRGHAALLRQVGAAAAREPDPERPVGVINAGNERDERGGFTLYVPENYAPDRDWPLIIACHGGSGHGADFLWSWLREARTRGCLLLAPTAVDRTWSIIEPGDHDAPNLKGMLDFVGARYRIDSSRILLTGMSDGGTYTLLAGLSGALPVTHLAPFSGVLHPFLYDNGGILRAAGMPIYVVHGVLDWMFPVDRARLGAELLTKAGADLTYREIDDLSHTYARDENERLLDWFGVPAPATAG